MSSIQKESDSEVNGEENKPGTMTKFNHLM